MRKFMSAALALVTAFSMSTAAFAEAQEPVATAETEGYVIELDPQYNVPTEELLEKFPITYQTPATIKVDMCWAKYAMATGLAERGQGMEKSIRLLQLLLHKNFTKIVSTRY